jgi:hypothetical protein
MMCRMDPPRCKVAACVPLEPGRQPGGRYNPGMPFAIFSVLSFLVLRLSTRARVKTLIWIALACGLLADFSVDLLVTLQR